MDFSKMTKRELTELKLIWSRFRCCAETDAGWKLWDDGINELEEFEANAK